MNNEFSEKLLALAHRYDRSHTTQPLETLSVTETSLVVFVTNPSSYIPPRLKNSHNTAP